MPAVITPANTISKLVTALDSLSAAERGQAIDQLGRIGPEAVPTLLEAAAGRGQRVRRGVVTALGRIGGPQAAEAVLPFVFDSDATIQTDAGQALLRLLLENAGPGFRWEAEVRKAQELMTLGCRLKTHPAQSPLAMVGSPRTQLDAWRVRGYWECVFSRLESRETTGPSSAEQYRRALLPELIPTLRDPECPLIVRCALVAVLGMFGGGPGLSFLLDYQDPEPQPLAAVRLRAVSRLLAARPDQCAAHLIGDLASRRAVRLVEDAGDGALELFSYAVGGPDRGARLRAAELLGRLPPPAGFELLARLLEDPVAAVSAAAARSLAARKDAAAVPHLLRRLEAGPEPLRNAVALALGRMEAPEAVAPLWELFQSRPELQGRTSLALALLGESDARLVPGLTRLLAGSDRECRVSAAEALARLAAVAPTVHLRAALPVLRKRLHRWVFTSGPESAAFLAALAAIELATDPLRSLPVPAGTAPESMDNLPRPV